MILRALFVTIAIFLSSVIPSSSQSIRDLQYGLYSAQQMKMILQTNDEVSLTKEISDAKEDYKQLLSKNVKLISVVDHSHDICRFLENSSFDLDKIFENLSDYNLNKEQLFSEVSCYVRASGLDKQLYLGPVNILTFSLLRTGNNYRPKTMLRFLWKTKNKKLMSSVFKSEGQAENIFQSIISYRNGGARSGEAKIKQRSIDGIVSLGVVICRVIRGTSKEQKSLSGYLRPENKISFPELLETYNHYCISKGLGGVEAGVGVKNFAGELWNAINDGQVELATQLLLNGAAPNVDLGDREVAEYDSPLILAIAGGFDDLAQKLLIAGADPNYRGKVGQTPLALAIRKNSSNALIKSLINSGADVNMEALDDSTGFEFDFSWRAPLQMAIARDNIEIVKAILPTSSGLLTDDMVKMLVYAVRAGKFEVAKYFHQIGIKLDSYGDSLLHQSVLYINIRELDFLLSLGQDINAEGACGSPLNKIKYCSGIASPPIEFIDAMIERGAVATENR